MALEKLSGDIDWTDPLISKSTVPMIKGFLYHGVAGLLVGKRTPNDDETRQLLKKYKSNNPSVWWNWLPLIIPSTLVTAGSAYYLKTSSSSNKKSRVQIAAATSTIFFGGISLLSTLCASAVNHVCPTPQFYDCQVTKELMPYDKFTSIPIEYKQNQIWIYQRDFLFQGIPMGGRTNFISLDNNESVRAKNILVYSPLPLTSDLKQFIQDQDWNIKCIIAPNSIHTLFTKEWQTEFADAKVIGAPFCDVRNKSVRWDYVLNGNATGPVSDASGSWNEYLGLDEEVLQFVVMKTGIFHEEIVVLHKPTKVLIVSDNIENVGYSPENDGNKRMIMTLELFGMRARVSAPTDFKLGVDGSQYVRSVEEVLKLDFETILCSHGRIVEKNAKDIYKMANAFVL